ncbi:uncharacterized protein METZ01_LOCUS458028, partial [marine metagenome]
GHMGCHKMAAIWGWDVTLIRDFWAMIADKRPKRGYAIFFSFFHFWMLCCMNGAIDSLRAWA